MNVGLFFFFFVLFLYYLAYDCILFSYVCNELQCVRGKQAILEVLLGDELRVYVYLFLLISPFVAGT